MNPKEEKDIYTFMGNIEARMSSLEKNIAKFDQDVEDLKVRVSQIQIEFSNLKGKLFAVAGIVTLLINGGIQFIKGFF